MRQACDGDIGDLYILKEPWRLRPGGRKFLARVGERIVLCLFVRGRKDLEFYDVLVSNKPKNYRCIDTYIFIYSKSTHFELFKTGECR